MALTYIVLDFETVSDVDLEDCGAARYAEDASTEIICLCFKDKAGKEWTWTPSGHAAMDAADEALCHLVEDSQVTFVMFANFEKWIWKCIMHEQFGFQKIEPSRWHDIQAVAAMKVMPIDLKRLCQVLETKHQKDMTGNALMKTLHKKNKAGNYVNLTPENIAKTIDYCLADIRAEWDAHSVLGFLPSGERSVWLVNQRINDRGVRIDMPYVRACQQVVGRASVPLLRDFRALTGLNPTQRDKFMDWIKEEGFHINDLRKETLAGLLGESEEEDVEVEKVEMPERVERALRIRQLIGSSAVSKLERMAMCVCDDGRAHGLLMYHGAGPGRSTGRLFQPQNFPRPTLKHGDKPIDADTMVAALMTGDPEYVDLVVGPPIEAVAQGLRHALIPNPDRVFVSGDYAGIQLRVLLALAGQHDKCELLAKGLNAYCDMAQQIYKRPIDKHNDVPEYTIGKNSVLGLGFQMGPPKFHSKYAPTLAEEFIEDVVRIYRKEWAPKVPKVWYGLEDAAVRTVWDRTPHEAFGIEYRIEDMWLTARLPSGRKLWYFGPEPCKKKAPWTDDDGNPVYKDAFTYMAMKKGQWGVAQAFGGLLTENVVMGMECDIARRAAIKLEQNNFPMVLEVHDELVVEPLIKDADEKAITQIMVDVDPWVKEMQVPIAIETWKGRRYRK